jgi:hypothetical protein
MLGVEYMAAGLLTLAAAEGPKCVAKTAPQFNITATGMEYVVDHTKSIPELTALSRGAYSPYAKGVKTFTEGLMRGRITTGTEFSWGIETYYDQQKSTCLYVEKIDVKIHIDPTVYIAKEYKKGGCMYDAVMEHEMKHIDVDRKIVNKYTYIIIRALDNTFKKVGYAHGPVNGMQRKALEAQIISIVNGVVGQFSNNMNKERDLLQQQVDSLAEYKRVDALCKRRR